MATPPLTTIKITAKRNNRPNLVIDATLTVPDLDPANPPTLMECLSTIMGKIDAEGHLEGITSITIKAAFTH